MSLKPPTFRSQPPTYQTDLKTKEIIEAAKALYEGRASPLPKGYGGSIDFDKAIKPLLDELEDAERITSEDLSIHVGIAT